MATTQKREGASRVPVTVRLEGAAAADALDALQAIVYDRTGRAAAQAELKVARKGEALVAEGVVELDAKRMGNTGRLVIAPPLARGEGKGVPRRADLEKRLGAWTEPFRLDPERLAIDVRIPRPGWEIWPHLCFCWVRGRLVKRVQLPDGTSRELPICNARVTLCEVDRWPLFIERLPDPDLFRLRDELLEVIRHPIPIPDPPPEPWPGPLVDVGPVPEPQPFLGGLMRRVGRVVKRAAPVVGSVARVAAPIASARLASESVALPAQLLASRVTDVPAAVLRDVLKADFALIRPYLCLLDFLEPFFFYSKSCFATVNTDEQGRFGALYVHACGDHDTPDIYLSAQQFLGGAWTTIYAPSIRCGTRWNYHCGDEITVVVTDPRAQPCIPDEPVDPPAGVDNWVMPFAVGGMPIRGTAAGGASPDGWVRPDGLVNYSGLEDAPFGSVLGFRQQHSLTIPNAGAYYYRWSFRRGTSGDFTAMTSPVTRTYVRDIPGPGVSFPNVLLGPQPGDVFRFKTQLFSPADWGVDTSGDPAGTQYYWPIDNSIGDLYAARWTTPGTGSSVDAPSLADVYQVKVEVFDNAKNRVAPGGGTFRFIVPTGFDADGTLQTRVAAAPEIVDDGFVFTLVVDNSRCTSFILPPVLSAGEADDDCGFLRYAGGASVDLAFQALHPHDRAVLSVEMVRGATHVPAAEVASEEVAAATAGSYARTGDTFTGTFAVSGLLGTCPNAAFAHRLYVSAKATDGTSRLSEYDAAFMRAFALAQMETEA
jgi:hypothetical protein